MGVNRLPKVVLLPWAWPYNLGCLNLASYAFCWCCYYCDRNSPEDLCSTWLYTWASTYLGSVVFFFLLKYIYLLSEGMSLCSSACSSKVTSISSSNSGRSLAASQGRIHYWCPGIIPGNTRQFCQHHTCQKRNGWNRHKGRYKQARTWSTKVIDPLLISL